MLKFRQNEARAFFDIGAARWKAVVKNVTKKKTRRKKKVKWNAVSNEEVKLMMDHLGSVPKEEGFPCGHRGLCL